MRQIVQHAEESGPDAVAGLLPLLDEPTPAEWLAHHLVELAFIDLAIRAKCISIVKQLVVALRASGDGLNAMGEESWLQDYQDG
jgi:hypothetical protein